MHLYVRYALPFASVLALAVAGCQAPASSPAPVVSAQPAAPVVADGTLNLDLSRLLGKGAERRVQADEVVVAPTPTAVRVRVRTPEATPVTETVLGVDAAVVSVNVTSGKNRLVEIETLVADGASYRVLQRIAAIATVPPSGTVALKPDYATTAAADTLSLLFQMVSDTNRPATDRTKLRTALTNFDLADTLTDIVVDETGYHAGMNAFKEYNPIYFPTTELAEQLYSYMIALSSDATGVAGFEPGGLAESSASLLVRVGGADDAEEALPLNIQLFTPEAQTDLDVFETTTFQVPPGTWTAVARQGDREAWGTVTVPSDAFEASLDLLFPDAPPVDHWIYQDSVENGWSVTTDVVDAEPGDSLETLDLEGNAGGDETSIVWLVPAGPTPGHLTITRPSDVDVEAYRYLNFKVRSSTSRAPFEVLLQDAHGENLLVESQLLNTFYNEGPLWPFSIDLSDPAVIAPDDRAKIAKVVFRYQPSEGTPDFYLDDVAFSFVALPEPSL